MKKIFLLSTLCSLFSMLSLNAQVVRIETEQGTKVYNLKDVKSISFSDEEYSEQLVKVDVMHASPLAFDLQVTKSPSCLKYMVAVLPSSTFKESDFVFGAEQTLDANAYYRPYETTLSYESRLFSESALGINSLTDADGKAQELVAAVYAIDDLGCVQVSTNTFVLPTSLKYESNIKMKIETNDIAYNHVTYTISPTGWTKPAKIIYGSTQPDWMKTTIESFDKLSDTGKRDFLVKQGLGLPQAYNSKIQVKVDCNAESDIIIYALPIDEEGKIGDMTIATVKTPAAEANGAGSFTSLAYKGETYDEEEFYGKAHFEIGVQNAVAYRLLWAVESEFNDNGYQKTLTETFLNEKLGEYGVWRQFKASDKTVALDIVRPGQDYVLYGVTVDVDGNISQPVDLLTTFTTEGAITTTPRSE